MAIAYCSLNYNLFEVNPIQHQILVVIIKLEQTGIERDTNLNTIEYCYYKRLDPNCK